MGRIICDDLVLSTKETRNLMNSLIHPDMEAIEKRNKLLNSLNDLYLKNDNDMPAFEIPGFSLPFITNIIYSSEKIRKKHDDICTESEFSVNINYSGNSEFMQLESNSDGDYYLQKTDDNRYTDAVLSFGFAA